MLTLLMFAVLAIPLHMNHSIETSGPIEPEELLAWQLGGVTPEGIPTEVNTRGMASRPEESVMEALSWTGADATTIRAIQARRIEAKRLDGISSVDQGISHKARASPMRAGDAAEWGLLPSCGAAVLRPLPGIAEKPGLAGQVGESLQRGGWDDAQFVRGKLGAVQPKGLETKGCSSRDIPKIRRDKANQILGNAQLVDGMLINRRMWLVEF